MQVPSKVVAPLRVRRKDTLLSAANKYMRSKDEERKNLIEFIVKLAGAHRDDTFGKRGEFDVKFVNSLVASYAKMLEKVFSADSTLEELRSTLELNGIDISQYVKSAGLKISEKDLLSAVKKAVDKAKVDTPSGNTAQEDKTQRLQIVKEISKDLVTSKRASKQSSGYQVLTKYFKHANAFAKKSIDESLPKRSAAIDKKLGEIAKVSGAEVKPDRLKKRSLIGKIATIPSIKKEETIAGKKGKKATFRERMVSFKENFKSDASLFGKTVAGSFASTQELTRKTFRKILVEIPVRIIKAAWKYVKKGGAAALKYVFPLETFLFTAALKTAKALCTGLKYAVKGIAFTLKTVKKALSGIYSLVKKSVSMACNVIFSPVKFIYGKIVKALKSNILKKIVKFLFTPKGAFFLGFLAGLGFKFILKPALAFLGRVKDSVAGLIHLAVDTMDKIGDGIVDFSERLLNTTTDIVDRISERMGEIIQNESVQHAISVHEKHGVVGVLQHLFHRMKNRAKSFFKKATDFVVDRAETMAGGAIGGMIGAGIGIFFGPVGVAIGALIGSLIGEGVTKALQYWSKLPEQGMDEEEESFDKRMEIKGSQIFNSVKSVDLSKAKENREAAASNAAAAEKAYRDLLEQKGVKDNAETNDKEILKARQDMINAKSMLEAQDANLALARDMQTGEFDKQIEYVKELFKLTREELKYSGDMLESRFIKEDAYDSKLPFQISRDLESLSEVSLSIPKEYSPYLYRNARASYVHLLLQKFANNEINFDEFVKLYNEFNGSGTAGIDLSKLSANTISGMKWSAIPEYKADPMSGADITPHISKTQFLRQFQQEDKAGEEEYSDLKKEEDHWYKTGGIAEIKLKKSEFFNAHLTEAVQYVYNKLTKGENAFFGPYMNSEDRSSVLSAIANFMATNYKLVASMDLSSYQKIGDAFLPFVKSMFESNFPKMLETSRIPPEKRMKNINNIVENLDKDREQVLEALGTAGEIGKDKLVKTWDKAVDKFYSNSEQTKSNIDMLERLKKDPNKDLDDKNKVYVERIRENLGALSKAKPAAATVDSEPNLATQEVEAERN